MKLVKIQSNVSAIECARQLLARCESGEVMAFTSIEEQPGGHYQVQGSTTSSRTATAGMRR